MSSYVYEESERGLFTVGHYTPARKWISESDHEVREDAASRVHYLNGGSKCMSPDVEGVTLSPAYAEAVMRAVDAEARKEHASIELDAIELTGAGEG